MNETPAIMTPPEAAKYLNVSLPTLRRAVRANQIPSLKIGNRWRVSRAALDRFLSGEEKQAVGKGMRRS